MSSDVSEAINDPDRLAALRETALVDSPAEEAFDRLTRLASRMLRVPVALVSLVEADRQFFKSGFGLSEPLATRRENPLAYSFCQFAVASKEAFIVADAREHPLVRDNPAVHENGVLAYAGVPLVTTHGFALGTLCVADTHPRSWSDDEVAVLRDLAASATVEIELRAALKRIERQTAEAEQRRNLQEAAEAALRQRAFLREVLFSVTEGRLRLCLSGDDLPARLPGGGERIALSKSELQPFRRRVQEAALNQGLPVERSADLVSAVSEAAMNAVVHGNGGAAWIYTDAERGTVQIWVEDAGGGIAFEHLHRATLERGWTTAGSMGCGFWLMLKTADHVYLQTGPEGTMVVIEQHRQEPEPIWLQAF